MTELSATIDLSGPFFERDPGLTLRGNITKMMEGLAEEGERVAREGYRATEQSRAPISLLGDKISSHVRGRVTSLAGKRWRASAVISINNAGFSAAEGISLMAAASLVERRTHVMRTVARQVRSARAVLAADLTAGLE